MVKHLLARSVRSNLGLLGIILAVLAMYGGIIVTMYDPELGDTLNSMAAAMPELFAAFGMAGTPATLTEFLVNYLYGFLLLVFPLVMSILLANRLVASYVDSGAVAYLLASPHSRAAIIATQAVVHIVSNWICLAIFLRRMLGVLRDDVPRRTGLDGACARDARPRCHALFLRRASVCQRLHLQ